MQFRSDILMKRPRIFQRLTGLTPNEFDRLLAVFAAQYQRLVVDPRLPQERRQRQPGGGRHGAIPGDAEKLLFMLVYTRVYPLLFVQGLWFGMSEGQACTWVQVLLPVLDAALGKSHARPLRARGRSLEEIIRDFPELQDLGIQLDGTERPVRRPKDAQQQQETYSGKKKRQMRKHVTVTHPKTQRILAVSEEAVGTVHDKRVLDETAMTCTSRIIVEADSAFVGTCIGTAIIHVPYKRKRTKQGEPRDELTAEQKAWNAALAQRRISIEHSNAGFKRNRSVSDILRNTRHGISDLLAMVAMGLHNFRVMLRPSYQMRAA